MNHNPIEELRKMETPVTEQEWASILHDKRYIQKFGRKSGLSPKGRAVIIAGVAAALITIPILVKTFTHTPTATEQTAPTVTESTVSQPAASASTQTESASKSVNQASADMASAPAKVGATSSAAIQEQTAMTSTIVERAQASNIQKSSEIQTVTTAVTTKPSVAQTATEVKSTPTVTKPTPTVAQKAVVEDATDDFVLKSEPEEEEMETEQFFIPSAFTPNGDGLNDLFYVKANFEPRNFEMTIISRNGDLLFRSRDINIGWDGQLHGNTLPHGMYVYIIKYKDREGNDQKQQGQILLIP